MSLLHKGNLKYIGAFRVPVHNQPDGTYGYYFGGTGLVYNEFSNSLIMVGHDHKQWIGEISIPEVRNNVSAVSDLATAEPIQAPSDWLDGRITSVDGDKSNGVKIGGILVLNKDKFVISAWNYYDGGSPKQTLSHFIVNRAKKEINGPFQIGKGWQKYYPPDQTTIAGMVSGYMCNIPAEHTSAAGSSHLTGQGGGISVINRTSSGPSATIFNPLADNRINQPTLVMGYPQIDQSFQHQTLGIWGEGGGLNLYDGTQYFRGMLFPDGFDSVLFFGWGGSSFCYGSGSSDPTLHEKPLPSDPNVIYCYDPINSSKGTHGYPYNSIVYAYDFNDFLAAKNNTKIPYDVVPYDTFALDKLPFQEDMIDGVDKGDYSIVGAAFKKETNEIFLSAYRNDGDRPLIHVLKVE